MCVIIIKKPGVALPSAEALKNCETINQDGAGVAVVKSGAPEVRIKKDFENSARLHAWLTTNITLPDSLLIHFRLATHGLKDVGNRHPFPLTDNKSLIRQPNLICQHAAVHNGILTQFGRHHKYSDSQKFVLSILGNTAIKHNLDNPAVQKLLYNFIGQDKLAILNWEGKIYQFGEFIEDKGLLYSNSSYLPPQQWQKVNWWGYDDKDYCDICGSNKKIKTVGLDDSYMNTINACQNCIKKNHLHDNSSVHKKEEYQCENCLQWFSRADISKSGLAILCRRCAVEYNIKIK